MHYELDSVSRAILHQVADLGYRVAVVHITDDGVSVEAVGGDGHIHRASADTAVEAATALAEQVGIEFT